MKKLICFLMAGVTMTAAVFSDSFFDDIDFSQYVEGGISKTERSVEDTLISVDAAYGFDLENNQCDFAVKLNKDIFDFTYSNKSWFFFQDYKYMDLSYGLCGDFHYLRYFDILTEYDLIAGTCFAIDFPLKYRFSCTSGYHFKTQWNDGINFRNKWHTIMASLEFSKMFYNGAEILFAFTSHDRFRFPLFVSPSWILEGAWNQKSWRYSAAVQVRVCDEFTTAPYADMIVFRTGVKYSF